MATKKGTATQNDSEKMVDEIRQRLEDVFLAGLGAFANAQKTGEKTFDKLVKEGEKFRSKTARKTESLIDDVRDAIREMTDGTQSKVSGLLDQVRDTSRLDKFNEAFDRRVADAMDRLQMATKKDTDALGRKLNKILKHLEEKQPVTVKLTAPTPTTAAEQSASSKKSAPRQAA